MVGQHRRLLIGCLSSSQMNEYAHSCDVVAIVDSVSGFIVIDSEEEGEEKGAVYSAVLFWLPLIIIGVCVPAKK
uniref:Uncharacterized protein n=1 Tax=Acrobeloides nanus TaxID=290746 RepID=A0A914E7H1_9BILA